MEITASTAKNTDRISPCDPATRNIVPQHYVIKPTLRPQHEIALPDKHSLRAGHVVFPKAEHASLRGFALCARSTHPRVGTVGRVTACVVRCAAEVTH